MCQLLYLYVGPFRYRMCDYGAPIWQVSVKVAGFLVLKEFQTEILRLFINKSFHLLF